MGETPVKYVFVTGGVVSGLGKGISAASLGTLLKARGLAVSLQKCDPYLNVDPGTMSPFQHGEVYVTEDGAETDLDLGHYERFTDENLSRISNVTTGAVYDAVIKKERRGDFLGATVQVIPHVTDEIKGRIRQAAGSSSAEVVVVEIGRTVGDIESLPFLEAIRQLRNDVGRQHVCFVHVTLVPYLDSVGELKTKTTQHSVNELRRIGIEPDVLVLRSNRPLTDDIRQKIALYGGIPAEAVISAVDAGEIYEVPLNLEAEGFARVVCDRLGLRTPSPDLTDLAPSGGADRGLRGRGAHRPGRQVRAAPRRVPVRGRGAQARRHPPRGRAADRLGRRRGPRPGRRARSRRRRPRAGRLRRARHRGKDRGRPPRPRARDPLPRDLPGHADRGGRVRAPRLRNGRGQLERVRPRDALPGHRPAARAARHRGARRDDAAGRRPGPPGRGHAHARRLRRPGGHLRAPPPPLRGQPGDARADGGRRPRGQRALAERAPRRGHRAAGPSVVLRLQFHPEFKSRPTRPQPLFREFVGAAALSRAREVAPEREPARLGG